MSKVELSRVVSAVTASASNTATITISVPDGSRAEVLALSFNEVLGALGGTVRISVTINSVAYFQATFAVGDNNFSEYMPVSGASTDFGQDVTITASATAITDGARLQASYRLVTT